MSVVNRMLQDIDRRLGGAGVEPLGAPAGIRSIPVAAAASHNMRARGITIVALCLLALAAIAVVRWQEWGMRPAAPTQAASTVERARPAQAVAAAPAVPRPAPAAPAETPATPHPAPIPSGEIPAAHAPAPPPVAAASPPSSLAAAAEGPVAVTARKSTRPTSADTLKLTMQLSAPISGEPHPRVAKAPAAQGSAVPVRRVAADETVLAARSLWSDGAHGAALATLREALAVAESSRNLAAAATLAREQARLEVADNRPQAALDLLRRMEPHLRADAEALALRGNAEQRLALHADAAASYLAALRLRPAEGRWMLGAAISLAAGGDLAAAQALVDQARDRGAVTPPIAAYLHQLGLAVRQ